MFTLTLLISICNYIFLSVITYKTMTEEINEICYLSLVACLTWPLIATYLLIIASFGYTVETFHLFYLVKLKPVLTHLIEVPVKISKGDK